MSIRWKITEFKKAIPELTVDGTARKQAELDKEREEKSDLKKEIQRSKTFESKLGKMENDMKEMQFKYHEAKGNPLTEEELEKLAKKIKKLQLK